MEYIEIIEEIPFVPDIIHPVQVSGSKPFIEANTTSVSLQELSKEHLIPVYATTNEPLISHADFINAVKEIVDDVYQMEQVLEPNIRISHEVLGRIPEAKNKKPAELSPWEITKYNQRMMFVVDIPSITSNIDGETLSLTIGGIRNYADNNLYGRNVGNQKFKIFAGFKVKVCSNLTVWADSVYPDVKVSEIGQLKYAVRNLLENYNHTYHLHHLNKLTQYSISEQQFAQIIGRCRMYQHLPNNIKKNIHPILFGDTQMSAVVRDYYKDASFCKDANGNINLWKLFNLFTGSNKSSYIDSFLDRSVNAFNIVEQVRYGLEGKNECWYLQ
jgi:hypothetical protein